MTKEEIIQKGTAAYERPRLLNTNTMHYCPGCSHGVVHKLIAEVVDEMGMAENRSGSAPSVAAYSPTIISTSTSKKPPTDVLQPLPPVSNVYCRITWFSPTKATEMPQVSAPTKPSTRSIAEKESPLSSSTTQSTE